MKQSVDCVTNPGKRIDWIDRAKGIGIVLVVLGHTYGIPHWLYCLIYGFHMPLFFLLSGLTFRYDTDDKCFAFVKKLAKKYLAPYAVLAGINLVLQCLWLWYLGDLSTQVVLKYFCGIIYCYANMDWMPNCSPIWFLPGIFFAKLFVFAACRYFKGNNGKITITVLVLGGIAWIANRLGAPRLPWNVLPAMMGTVFLWGGCCLRQDCLFMNRGYNRISLLSLATALLLSPAIAWNVPGMNQNDYDHVILFLISGFGYSFGVILFSLALPKISGIFAYFGTGTVIFMGFNYFARTFSTELYYLVPYIRNHPITPFVSFWMTMGVLVVILEMDKKRKRVQHRRNCHAISCVQ